MYAWGNINGDEHLSSFYHINKSWPGLSEGYRAYYISGKKILLNNVLMLTYTSMNKKYDKETCIFFFYLTEFFINGMKSCPTTPSLLSLSVTL